MSRVLPLVGGRALKVIDTIDVFSTRHEKVGQFGVQDLVVDPAAEQMRLRRGDVAIAIQHNERQVLEALVPGLTIVTAGVDFEVLEETSAPRGRARAVRRLGQSHEPPRPSRLPAARVAARP